MARMTPEQVEQITAYAEKGKSGSWIARKLGLSDAGVNYRMLRAGHDPWPGHGNLPRNPRHPGAFTPEEDDRMLELGKSMAPHKVAEIMGRPRTSVLIRLLTLEVRAEKKLEQAA